MVKDLKICYDKRDNAKSLGSAKNVAFSIANSPLVKTAVAGESNWEELQVLENQERLSIKKIKN